MDGKIQWHPAFCSALKIALAEDADALEYQEEHLLSKKPMQVDMLVIKKQEHRSIKKTVGHIFRGHNLIEYKSPDDGLSVNDFYKVSGYACFYQSDTKEVLEIHPDDITITFACSHYPRKFLSHLKERLHISVREYSEGIYYLSGGLFPMQLLLTHRLVPEDYYWLQSLRKNLKSGGEIRRLIECYDPYKKSKLYQSVMNVILQANWKEAEVERKMCEALKRLFAEDFEECEKRGLECGRQEGRLEGKALGEALGILLTKKVFHLVQQGKTEDEIAKECDITVEKVREILD